MSLAIPIVLPALPLWLQQLAGILPITALIEFTDLATKLHIFELTGSVSLWNWPVTPAGARMLLSGQDTNHACCLDHIGKSLPMQCIDGRFGDHYPCSTPATTRMCVLTCRVCAVVPNVSENMADASGRKQKLELILLTKVKPALTQRTANSHMPFSNALANLFGVHSVRYWFMSAIGWLRWTAATSVSLMGRLYIAAAYLVLMPLTGLLARFTHCGKPRRLLDERSSSFSRMKVTTSSLNGSDWWAFYGGSFTANSLLNKPLYRAGVTPAPRLLQPLLRLLIGGQWVLAVGSCAMQDWNALLITFWLAFCVCASTYAFPPESGVYDWLRDNCNLSILRVQAEFSSRRSMLSAMLYLNPDSKERRTDWITPILASSDDRKEWESALLDYMHTGEFKKEAVAEYWWKYVQEGLKMGKKIERIIQDQSKEQA